MKPAVGGKRKVGKPGSRYSLKQEDSAVGIVELDPIRLEGGSMFEKSLHMRRSFLPQICHKAKRAEKENSGFLRVTAGRNLVAKTAPKGRLFS